MAALAEKPGLTHRCVAAAVAGLVALLIVQLLLGIWLGLGTTALWISASAAVLAAGYAAATTRWGMAIVFGVLGVLWMLAEALALLFSVLVSGLG